MRTNSVLLQLLGTGTCVPEQERSSAAYWLMFRDINLLLDIGTGCLQRIAQAGRNYKAIDAVCLTHFHPDHCSDLAPLLLALQYTPGFTREKPLTLCGPVGLKRHLDTLAALYGDWLKRLRFPVNIVEMGEPEFRIGEVRLIAEKAAHGSAALSYRLEFPGNRSITYSGDTSFSRELAQLASGTNLLLVECSSPDPIDGHLTPDEVGEIAAMANCETVVLTHFYPLFESKDPVAVVRKKFDGKVIAGKDLQEFYL